MEKWIIRPAPTPFDPRRHLLLLQGEMKDVSRILKKFGSMCGRPSGIRDPEGFNYSIYLHGLSDAGMEKLQTALREMAPAAAPAAVPAASPSPGPTEPAALPPTPVPAAPLEAPPSAAAPELVPLSPPPAAPPPETPAPAPTLQEPPAPTPAPPAPVLAEPPAPVPPTPAPVPAPPAPVTAAPAPALVAAAAALPARPLWGLQDRLDPQRTFDSLLVGAYNRFAHAAATSVVSAPGSMYNPLFLYGSPGTGKTHLLNAVGNGMAQAVAEENVVLTSGARLSRAVSGALAAGKIAELEDFLQKAKVLLVDDIHLLAVTDANRAALAKVFALFFGRNLQVVITSIYPPRALGALEEALKISFAKGWSVDLKAPNPAVQVEILTAFFDRHGVNITPEEVKRFHEQLGTGYPESLRWLRRLMSLIALRRQAGQDAKLDELFALLFDPGSVAGPDVPGPKDLEAVKGWAAPAPGADVRNLAVLVPKGHDAMGTWILSRFYECAATAGVSPSYRPVLVGTYDAGQPFGVPFQIGEMCQRAQAQAALVLGPPGDSNLASRVAEFSHAVGHILEGLDVPMGWIPHRGTMAAAHFVRAHLDLMVTRA